MRFKLLRIGQDFCNDFLSLRFTNILFNQVCSICLSYAITPRIMKSMLITRTINSLKKKKFYNIKAKYRESKNNKVFSPNVIAYSKKQMHLIDVKSDIHSNTEYVKKKWRYLSRLADSINAKFEIVVPENQLLYTRIFLLQNNLNPEINTA